MHPPDESDRLTVTCDLKKKQLTMCAQGHRVSRELLVTLLIALSLFLGVFVLYWTHR